MSYKIKSSELTKSIKSHDNQLEIDESNIFGRKNFIYLVVGKKGSGKTNLVLSLFETPFSQGGFQKRFHKIFMVSPTARNDAKLDELIEELERGNSFYDEITNDVVKEILEDIDTIKASWTKKTKPEFCIIFDDCIHSLPSNRKRNMSFNKLMTTNRHYNTTVIIMSQRLNELNPLVRSQADVISMFRPDNKKEEETFIDTYNVDETTLKMCFDENHSFITVSYLHGKPKVYKRYDLIETQTEKEE
jgi:hypothetical protein